LRRLLLHLSPGLLSIDNPNRNTNRLTTRKQNQLQCSNQAVHAAQFPSQHQTVLAAQNQFPNLQMTLPSLLYQPLQYL
jgi:hypothetical protein